MWKSVSIRTEMQRKKMSRRKKNTYKQRFKRYMIVQLGMWNILKDNITL